jgi:hypothetical protein
VGNLFIGISVFSLNLCFELVKSRNNFLDPSLFRSRAPAHVNVCHHSRTSTRCSVHHRRARRRPAYVGERQLRTCVLLDLQATVEAQQRNPTAMSNRSRENSFIVVVARAVLRIRLLVEPLPRLLRLLASFFVCAVTVLALHQAILRLAHVSWRLWAKCKAAEGHVAADGFDPKRYRERMRNATSEVRPPATAVELTS